MNVDAKLNVSQEQISNNIVTARDLAHKAILASAGLLGMAYDTAKYGIENSQEVLEKAEKRGEELEEKFIKWYDIYVETAGSGVNKLKDSYDDSVEGVKDSVVGVKDSVTGVKGSVAGVKESVVNVKDVVTENTKGLQGMVVSTVATVASVRPGSNGKKDVPATVIEVKEEVVEAVGEALSAPFEEYDGLNAKDLIAKFNDMDDNALELVKAYEEATKNRVTVLREIDVRMEKEVA